MLIQNEKKKLKNTENRENILELKFFEEQNDNCRKINFRDMSTMVELTSFSTLGKIQPFLVTISATAALLVDLHCHLTDKEVCGYLGGHWDINSHSNFFLINYLIINTRGHTKEMKEKFYFL